MTLPEDYLERVYAGVLGKIIGVYLGRPFEGWTFERIMQELGEIDYYVNDRISGHHPLVVTDDDITGTFTFLRALLDYDNPVDLTSEAIGQTWLNYIIEGKTILWWGGFGNSTEHTAYLRLKEGIKAPLSGSSKLNGKLIAEQIGAQIFIDGWGMAAPGNPEMAAEFARQAARVSHDGEAVYAAQVLAVMQAQAFIESDIDKLLDKALSFIPEDSVTYKMITVIREWHAKESDWHACRSKIAGLYNYENFGGNCHIIPNHGLIILGLLFGNGDFNESMLIVNTSGWDTDCNSGNLGCLLGIRNGLSAFDSEKDWRGPVADRLYLPTADGGCSITDAVIETQRIVNIGHALIGEKPVSIKGGARFNFDLPGSVQGFQGLEETTHIENVPGNSKLGARSLAIRFEGIGRAATPTFILPEELGMNGYSLIASPTIYSGQTITAGITASQSTTVRLFIQAYNQEDQLSVFFGPEHQIEAGDYCNLEWIAPATHSQPIARIGVECQAGNGVAYLDYLSWVGEPEVTLTRPMGSIYPLEPPLVWQQAWIDGVDLWDKWWQTPFRLVQNRGRGMIIQGTREWANYQVEADITPWLMDIGGIAARVQGMKRYYALVLRKGNRLQLVKVLDGEMILAETEFIWECQTKYWLKLRVYGDHICAYVNDHLEFDVRDTNRPLLNGGVAFVIERGHLASQIMTVKPVVD